ncbi:MAG: hypothetical protein RI894_952 [Bacteroidota bacterium]|jgi:hypothetical protein
MRYSFLIISLLLAIGFSACRTTPKNEITAAMIAGKWTIISATRDTTPTSMLNNAYIDFKSNEVFTSLPLTEEGDSVVHSSFSMMNDSMNCPSFKTNFKFKKRHDTLNAIFNTQGHRFSVDMLK